MARATSSGTRHRDHASNAPLNAAFDHTAGTSSRPRRAGPPRRPSPRCRARRHRSRAASGLRFRAACSRSPRARARVASASRLRRRDVERRLQSRGHVVERLRERAQLLQPAAGNARVQIARGHVLGRARDAPERRRHHRRERGRQHESKHERQREQHGRAAAPRARPGQVERFRHGGDERPMTAGRVPIRRRVRQPRFARERLRRDVVESKLRRRRRTGRRDRRTARARPPHPRTTRSPLPADDAIIAPAPSRMNARPSGLIAWLRSSDTSASFRSASGAAGERDRYSLRRLRIFVDAS